MPTATTVTERLPDGIARSLVNPADYADGRIHEAYTWMRAHNPLGLAEPEGFAPFWAVTKHEDILAVSRKNDLFHNADRSVTLVDRATEKRTRDIAGGIPQLVRTLVQMDAPDHPKYRSLAQAYFLPSNLKKLEARIRDIARAAVDNMMAKGTHCEFVSDVALGYPLHVVMEILGVPEEDEPRMLMLTQQLFGPNDPDMARSFESLPNEQLGNMLHAVVSDFEAYFRRINEDRRANPRNDLATVIANAVIDDKPIGDSEATGYYIIVATAGHDTTSSSTAGAMWALAENPEQLAQIRADISRVPGLVEEAIRWMTPVKTFMRAAARDTEIRGRKLRRGDWLMLCYASGNRDEEIFDDPFVFRADRSPNRHLSFGYGAHLCLGQHLAKLEMRILFEELLPRIKSLSLAGEPKNTASTFVSGPKTLPLHVEWE